MTDIDPLGGAPVWRWALRYTAEHGLPILPLRAGEKVPATTHGVHDASTDAEQLGRWAEAMPYAGLGIACGGLLRLLVVDVDGLEGEASLAERFDPLPPTWTARTPKGGWHLYFTAPDDGAPLGNTARTLGPELDTRGQGGYVVCPPTRLADGRRYTWAPGCSPDDLERAPLPVDILAALRAPRVRTVAPLRPERSPSHGGAAGDITRRVAAYLRELPPLADGGGRNATAYRVAAFVLHDCGGTAADALTACEVWNARNVEPLPDDALARAVANAHRYGGRHAA